MPLWVPEWVVGIAGHLTCRLLRWHNILGEGLIDPERWNRWPRH